MQMLGTWLVTFQAIRSDGGRCFKGGALVSRAPTEESVEE